MQKTTCTANKNVFGKFSLFTKNGQDATGCKVKYGEVCVVRESLIPIPTKFSLFSEQCVVPPRRVLVHTNTEAESKEKHGVWDPMPELTMSTPESTPTHLP
jgi:hypothetical protein